MSLFLPPVAPPHGFDEGRLKALANRPDLIRALIAWNSSPNRMLAPKLQELAVLVNRLFPQKKMVVYRGFKPGGKQEDFGLTTEQVVALGDTLYHYEDATKSKAISFSTSRQIASGFGGVVVQTEVDPKRDHYLHIVPELVHLACPGFADIVTEAEVVLLPPISLTLKVIQTSKPSWLKW